eukprot:CAMPEP_0116134988 /NCGR_PEP_ID=MMETSP0329-20121206/10953_1 /TAXON_ID=697910 /ORGANISM="Pseudo-nitzschia arenysensis, Strain B593" /LENGTH=950 /DNA_ID=CAMNT_0003629763 /DNA_START=74 /DNA_END=2926 /DNA_ORIENTATION=+
MVQGNWERRAELSEARRLEAKQRKQRAGDRKVYKAQAQDLMSFLNRNADKLFRREMSSTIHIWTDSPTKDGSILDDQLWEDEQPKNKRNNKHDGDNGKGGRRGRGRSTSFEINDAPKTKNNKKKKFHPRSKDNPNSNNNGGSGESEATSAQAPKLCRKHFFYGKCCESTQKNRGSGGKKGSVNCRFAHYPKGNFTITDVLLPKRPRDADEDDSALIAKDAISSSESSYPEATLPGEKAPTADAMDMVYYLSFRTSELFAGLFDDEESSPQVSHAIVDAMTKQSCNIGSIVYFAVGNQLLYDRYQKGIVIEESELTGRNKTSTSKSSSTGRSIQSMPLSASILEHILLFLDDKAVASVSAVSRSWNREIGKQSVNLWRHLLQRRSWPVPPVSQGHNEDGISTLREAFVSHYTAVRDIDGAKKGIESLLHRKSMNEYDGSVRLFESSKSSSQTTNNCMAIKIWDTNSILAAYEHDCSLRLFDSVEGSESSGERVCRELVCHRVDPYKKTKKRNCQLVAVALDTDCIGSLLLVVDDNSGEENHILTVMSRENFLIDDDSNEDAMQVIDIRESVLNFLLSCEDVDHGLLQLHDYLANDGDLDNIDVIASQSLVECGFGRFMVEVAVAIPSIGNFDEHDSAGVLIFRKLFLFSTGVGAITWMSDSGPSSSLLRSLNEEITLAAYRREENYRAGYDIVSLSCVSPTIRSLSVDYGGSLQHSSSIEGTDLVRNEILSEQWSLRRSRKRPVVMVDYEVVAADNLVCEENGTKKSILTFYPMDNSMGRSTLRRLDLEGNLEVCHLIALRESHIVAICRVFDLSEDGDDVDQVAGHWFGPNNTSVVSSHAIVIDVKTRSEIYQTCFVDDLGQHLGEYSRGLTTIPGELPIQLAVRENTVAAGLGSKGVVMTGADSRKSQLNTSLDREELTTPTKSSKKAKKKKQGKKSGKKDGFARGQKM